MEATAGSDFVALVCAGALFLIASWALFTRHSRPARYRLPRPDVRRRLADLDAAQRRRDDL